MAHNSTFRLATNSHSARFRLFTDVLFFSVVAIYCVWVFSLAVFPSQDGGVHLYYTNVLSHLLSGGSEFNTYFYIRSPVPPYALHYYLLLALTKMTTPVMAEKLVVVLIIASFSIGFRFLARVTSSRGDLISLWSLPLALNWMLGMGFHNYCLSMALALWTLGVWFQGNKTGSIVLRILFVSLAVVMLLTHPVPLFVMLAIVWGDILMRVTQRQLRTRVHFRATLQLFWRDILFAFLAACTLAYISLFIDTHRSVENIEDSYLQVKTLLDFIRLKPLSLVSGNNAARILRTGFYIILAFSLWYGFRGFRLRLRKRSLEIADLFIVAAVAFIVLVPLLPRSINGADYFSDRLLIYIWIFALTAAGAHVEWSRTVRIVSNFGACAFALTALFIADHYIRPVASKIGDIETANFPKLKGPGLYVDALETPSHAYLTFDPFIWAAMRYFRRADAVIINAPWLDLRTMPVGPTQELLTGVIRPQILNYPEKFRKLVLNSPRLQVKLSRAIHSLLFVGDAAGVTPFSDGFVSLFTDLQSCYSGGWYAVCGVSVNQSLRSVKAVPFK